MMNAAIYLNEEIISWAEWDFILRTPPPTTIVSLMNYNYVL